MMVNVPRVPKGTHITGEWFDAVSQAIMQLQMAAIQNVQAPISFQMGTLGIVLPALWARVRVIEELDNCLHCTVIVKDINGDDADGENIYVAKPLLCRSDVVYDGVVLSDVDVNQVTATFSPGSSLDDIVETWVIVPHYWTGEAENRCELIVVRLPADIIDMNDPDGDPIEWIDTSARTWANRFNSE